MKLTDWFPGDVKPARPGVYERLYRGGGVGFANWTGSSWGYRCETVDDASMHRHESSFQLGHKDTSWRGLAKKP